MGCAVTDGQKSEAVAADNSSPGAAATGGRASRIPLLGSTGGSGPVATAVAVTARWCARFLLIAAAGWLLWQVAVWSWPVLLPVIMALFVSALLWPVVRLLRRFMPPTLAVVVTMLAALAVIVAVIALIVPQIRSDWPELLNSGQQGVDKAVKWAQGPPLHLGSGRLDDLANDAAQQVEGSVSSIASWALAGVGAVAGAITTGVLALIAAFMMLKDGPKLVPWLRGWTSPAVHQHAATLAGRLFSTLGSYIQAQTLVSLIDAVFIGLGVLFVGVPFPLVLAIIVFVTGYLPVIGAFISGILAVLVALASEGLWPAVIVLAIVVLVQQLEGNVLAPWLVGKSMNLHGAVVLAVLTIGGAVGGIIGALLAVPLASAIAVVLRYIRERTHPERVPADGSDEKS